MIPIFCIKAANEWRTKYAQSPIRLAAGQECIDLVISYYREIPISNEKTEIDIMRKQMEFYKSNSDKWLKHQATEHEEKKNSQKHHTDRIVRLENRLIHMGNTLDKVLDTLRNPNVFVTDKVKNITPVILNVRKLCKTK